MEVVDLKQGLSSEQVTSSRLQEGSNTLEAREERVFGQVV